MVEGIFKDTAMEILVCIFDPRVSKKKEDITTSDPDQPGPRHFGEELSVLGQNSLKEGVVLQAPISPVRRRPGSFVGRQ